MNSGKDFEIRLNLKHRVRFTRDAFAGSNRLLDGLLETNGNAKILVFLDRAVAAAFPELESQIHDRCKRLQGFRFTETVLIDGGEGCKRDANTLQLAWDKMENAGIDRHSYVFCIGGGALLDVIGFAAATCHRGLRLVRFPTTTLSQDDSGVGVKNGINAYGKKNFLGAFSVPYAVVNDFAFLFSQPEHDFRAGLVEAVKVALVKDGDFFDWLEDNAQLLAKLNPHAVEEAVERSAMLHAAHIAYGGDPFENGNSRPLDYGHWAAHKLEQMTEFALTHADAVSIGVALDTLYSWKCGWLDKKSAMRVLDVLKNLRLPRWHDGLDEKLADGTRKLYAGLNEFREHLGGELTVLLLQEVGRGGDAHAMDHELLDECIDYLRLLELGELELEK